MWQCTKDCGDIDDDAIVYKCRPLLDITVDGTTIESVQVTEGYQMLLFGKTNEEIVSTGQVSSPVGKPSQRQSVSASTESCSQI
jgi:hypothetical protein